MKVRNRHDKILKILAEVPISTIQQLATDLTVSTETIRKDLKQLVDEDKVIQTHGGVVLKRKKNSYYPFDYRMKIATSGKAKIGKKASELVEFGDAIFLESSTTCLAMIQELCKNKEILNSLTIITNSFRIALVLEKEEVSCKVLFIGGWIDFSQHATTGQLAVEFLNQFYVNKAFIAGAALGKQLMVTGFYEHDILLQKKIMAHAEKTILLIDEEKYPKQGLIQLCPIEVFDQVVTDICFSKEMRMKMEERKRGAKLTSVLVQVK